MTDRPDDAPRRRPQRSLLRELPVLLLVALIVAFVLRTFVLQVFYIPSSSMEPTLQVNDRMVVEKISYRFRDPLRGEIIVFEGEQPEAEDVSLFVRVQRGAGQFIGVVPVSARDYVKRVIGVGGDTVEIVDGRVHVDGTPLDESYVVFDDRDNYGPVTVPAGHYFLLGDNRGNSSDSRRSLGFVPRDDVVGRAGLIIWPTQHVGRLTTVHHDLGSPAG